MKTLFDEKLQLNCYISNFVHSTLHSEYLLLLPL